MKCIGDGSSNVAAHSDSCASKAVTMPVGSTWKGRVPFGRMCKPSRSIKADHFCSGVSQGPEASARWTKGNSLQRWCNWAMADASRAKRALNIRVAAPLAGMNRIA